MTRDNHRGGNPGGRGWDADQAVTELYSRITGLVRLSALLLRIRGSRRGRAGRLRGDAQRLARLREEDKALAYLRGRW